MNRNYIIMSWFIIFIFFSPTQSFAKSKLWKPMLSTAPTVVDALFKQRGALIGNVSKGSDADKKGLKFGDVIISVNGKKNESPVEQQMIIEESKGKSITLVVRRNGKSLTKRIHLSNSEKSDIILLPKGQYWEPADAFEGRTISYNIIGDTSVTAFVVESKALYQVWLKRAPVNRCVKGSGGFLLWA